MGLEDDIATGEGMPENEPVEPQPEAPASDSVTLQVTDPNQSFEVPGAGTVTNEGVTFTREQADAILTAAAKYNVPVREVEK